MLTGASRLELKGNAVPKGPACIQLFMPVVSDVGSQGRETTPVYAGADRLG